ncbi:MAG: hypothetical protein WA906_03435 [Pacificimonas sp.]
MSDHPQPTPATEKRPPEQDSGNLSPDPQRGNKDGSQPQTQKDPVRPPDEQSD